MRFEKSPYKYSAHPPKGFSAFACSRLHRIITVQYYLKHRSMKTPLSEPNRISVPLRLMALLSLLWLICTRLPESLGLDELLTAAQLTPNLIESLRNMYWGVHSTWAFTPFLWTAQQLFGNSEIALRTPGVVFLLTAALLFRKTLLRWVTAESADIGALLLMAHSLFWIGNAFIRPY